MSLNDLGPLLVPPPTQAVRYGQGTILAWDPETFENRISWRGITLPNLPVLSGPDALTYQVGDTVGLLGWAPSDGSIGSWWILGRLVIPGTGQGEAAIDFMTTALGEAVAASVIANRIHSETVQTADSTTSSTYDDLDTFGPEIIDVEITDTGRAIVFASAVIRGGPSLSGDLIAGGEMSFEVSGATNLSPTFRSAQNEFGYLFGSDAVQTRSFVSATSPVLLTGLNPGLHTFTAKYRVTIGTDSGASSSFSDRNLTVIAF